MTRSLPVVVEKIAALHATVDQLVAPLVAAHGAQLKCARGCHACCVDDLTVFEAEAEVIRAHHATLLREGEPRAPGACAFLDEVGACRIYEHRPYVCRTQGLPLRWIAQEVTADGVSEVVEHRDACELNFVDGPAVEDLSPDTCWSIGPVESWLGAFAERDGSGSARVALRALFMNR